MTAILNAYLSKLTLLIAVFSSAFILVLPSLALAIDCSKCSNSSNLSTQESIQCGSSCASGNNQTSAEATDTLNQTIKTIINLLSVAIGLVAVIMIIFGGFRFVTSGGNPEAAKAARNTLLYAIIGLVVVALAQVIARFTLHAVVSTK
jgi:beta-lactamase regulating signal transducer with metallopeptidase domain